MTKTVIAYIELPAKDVAADRAFYEGLFGWSFQDWGPDYAAFSGSGVDGGLNGGGNHRPKAPLVILQTDALEAMQARIVSAGGTITMPIFTFPGGRRFHFVDLAGNELAVMQTG